MSIDFDSFRYSHFRWRHGCEFTIEYSLSNRVAIKYTSDVTICTWPRAQKKNVSHMLRLLSCMHACSVCVYRSALTGKRWTLHETYKQRRNPHGTTPVSASTRKCVTHTHMHIHMLSLVSSGQCFPRPFVRLVRHITVRRLHFHYTR